MSTRDSASSLIVAPGPTPQSVRAPNGDILTVPRDWALLKPGDAGLTRRVKAATITWTVQEKKGRRTFSQGLWAKADVIAAKQAELETERSTEAYAKKQLASKVRRDRKQTEYVESFETSVRRFLDFHDRFEEIASKLAKAVTDHATPVGSGTVARTERIPIERRAESAVIAWMRHQTTAYDQMKIARIKGERREVRRLLAERSRELLEGYRRGVVVSPETCPLQSALKRLASSNS